MAELAFGFQGELLTSGYCANVYADSSRVLKVPFQGEELDSGFRATLAYSETVGPRVIASDVESSSILMERIVPGTTLDVHGLSDEAQLQICVGFALRVREISLAAPLPLAKYFEIPSLLVRELLSTTTTECFLHGDLHHENVLWGSDRWWLIDPKGLFGDPAFEAAAYLHNPLSVMARASDSELIDLAKHRIAQWAESLGVSPDRIWAWAVAVAQSCIADGFENCRRELAALMPLAPHFGATGWATLVSQ
ncbi:MAG: aminoglycoside phosphotransferase family protein [Fimbriimonadaceae bacterium]